MSSDKESDDDLFEKAMAGVNRSHRNYRENRVSSYEHRDKPSTLPTARIQLSTNRAEPATVDITEEGDSVLFVRSGLQRKVIKKLKRGDYSYESVLDLHGMRIHEAETLLDEFLVESIQDNLSCVLIIHGKGYRSENSKGVLKPFTINRLKQCVEIKAFCSANPKDGGTGAVYVLLRRGLVEY